MRFNTALIVTYGRSGSTLLQGVLNTIDGCVIRGENFLFCDGLFDAFKAIRRAHENEGRETHSAWYGAHLLREDVFIAHARAMVRELLTGSTADDSVGCYGFKEIRYWDVVDELPEFLDFMGHLLPNLGIIFNTRAVEDVIRSSFWTSFEPDEATRIVTTLDAAFLDYDASHGNTFVMTYEDLVAKSDRLQRLFGFLEAPYSDEAIDRVLAVPHSYDPRQEHVKNMLPVGS